MHPIYWFMQAILNRCHHFRIPHSPCFSTAESHKFYFARDLSAHIEAHSLQIQLCWKLPNSLQVTVLVFSNMKLANNTCNYAACRLLSDMTHEYSYIVIWRESLNNRTVVMKILTTWAYSVNTQRTNRVEQVDWVLWKNRGPNHVILVFRRLSKHIFKDL